MGQGHSFVRWLLPWTKTHPSESPHPDICEPAVAGGPVGRTTAAPKPTANFSDLIFFVSGKISGTSIMMLSNPSSQKVEPPPFHSCSNFLFLVTSFPFINGADWDERDTPICYTSYHFHVPALEIFSDSGVEINLKHWYNSLVNCFVHMSILVFAQHMLFLIKEKIF